MDNLILIDKKHANFRGVDHFLDLVFSFMRKYS